MNSRTMTLPIFLLTAGLCAGTNVVAAEKVQWSYSGSQGPEHWGALDSSFSTCSSGKNQSPVNLTDMIDAELPPLSVDYKPGGNEIINNGHTLQVKQLLGVRRCCFGQPIW